MRCVTCSPERLLIHVASKFPCDGSPEDFLRRIHAFGDLPLDKMDEEFHRIADAMVDRWPEHGTNILMGPSCLNDGSDIRDDLSVQLPSAFEMADMLGSILRCESLLSEMGKSLRSRQLPSEAYEPLRGFLFSLRESLLRRRLAVDYHSVSRAAPGLGEYPPQESPGRCVQHR